MGARAEFEASTDDGIVRGARMSDNLALALLHLGMNDTALFDVVQGITGAGPRKCLLRRVYRMQAGGTLRLVALRRDRRTPDWHERQSEHGRGRFEMRPTGSPEVQWRVAHTGLVTRFCSGLAPTWNTA
jgi:hypothetical protein